MKLLRNLLILVALTGTASAQVSGVTQIQNAGVTTFPNRTKLNFVGGGCVDNPTTAAKDCTIVSGGGTVTSISQAAGITLTPNPIVATGTVAVDQGFSPTWTGTHIFTLKTTFSATTNQIGLGAASHLITISSTAPAAAAWTLTLPDPTANDTFTYLALAQTFSGVKTFNVGTLKFNNAANTFATLFATNATAARTITFPDATDTAAVLGVAQTYTKSQNVASFGVTDAASITTDSSQGNVYTVTLGGNRTLANPTNLVSGGQYQWIVTQGSGGQTLAYGNLFKFSGGIAPVLTTTASAVDMVTCVYNGTILGCVFTPDLR